MNKVLVVDDDTNICELLRLYIEKEGFIPITANDGNSAIEIFKNENPALVILDIMLPGIDGLQVLREIRKISNCPVIMLSAKGETFDKVLGLELGADDYMVKPFEAKEVTARIRAVLRRTNDSVTESNKIIDFDKLSINLKNYELKIDGKKTEAPPREIELLFYLASHPNEVFTRSQLLEKVWGFEYLGDSRTVDVHIKRLREKLEGISSEWELETVWGIGYKFEVK